MALPAAAQFYSLGSEPAGVKWYHLRTADFDVIYPKGLDSLARVYASTLERYKMPVGATAGYYPNQLYSKRLPVILHPWTANSNGMVAWTPRRMELLTTPTSVAPMPQPWEEHLVSHESRHVAQMQFVNEKPYRVASWFLGELTAGAVSAIYCGPSFFEGDAVAAETELSTTGRGRSASFLEYYRAAFREGDTRDFWRWRYGSLKYYTPDYYKVGYITMAGLRSVYDCPDFTARYYERLFRGKWHLPFFNMQGTVKEVSGKRFRDAFTEICDTLQGRWARDEAARAPFMPSRPLTLDSRHFTEYTSTCYMDSVLYCVRGGVTAPPALVRVDTAGQVSRVAPFAYSTSALKGDDNLRRIYWSEVVPDARWELKSYSELWYTKMDGRRQRFSRRTRWYNPSPSCDGMVVSATEYPFSGGSALVLVDALKGKVLRRIKAPDGMQISESEWIGNDVYVTAVTSGGLGIWRMDGDGFKLVLDCGSVNVKGLFRRGGELCFTADLTGVDELYALDPEGGSVVRLSSSPQGGGSYRFSPDGRYLVFSGLGTGGRNLQLTCTDLLPSPAPADFTRTHRYEFAEDLKSGAGEVSEAISGDVEDTPLPYNRLGHLFRFHSWAPVYVDYDAIEDMSFETLTTTAGLGATAFFQNHLNTMTGVVAYNAAPGKEAWSHRGEVRFTYSGFYPVIEANFSISSVPPSLYFLKTQFSDFGYYITLSSEQMTGRPSVNTGLTMYVPLRGSSGGWYRGLVPQLKWTVSNSFFTHGSFAPMNRVTASLRAYIMESTPPARIYPRFGIGLEGGWSGRPWAQNILTSCAYLYGYGYVPGFMDTHGIRLSAIAQMPTSDALFNERYAAVLPRGMAGYASLANKVANYSLQTRFTADYAFPFAPLDWSGMGPVAYLRNFECTLHGDYSYLYSRNESKVLASVGADLCAVLGNLLWIPEDTRLGVSYYYNIGAPAGESPHYWGAVFNVSF